MAWPYYCERRLKMIQHLKIMWLCRKITLHRQTTVSLSQMMHYKHKSYFNTGLENTTRKKDSCSENVPHSALQGWVSGSTGSHCTDSHSPKSNCDHTRADWLWQGVLGGTAGVGMGGPGWIMASPINLGWTTMPNCECPPTIGNSHLVLCRLNYMNIYG